MPYNPGSAYPRKTVYVPPTYGDTSFQRAVNAPNVSYDTSPGSGNLSVHGREKFAGQAAAAARASNHSEAGAGFAEMSRNGGLGDQLANRYKEQQGLKRGSAAQGMSQGNVAAQKKTEAAKDVSEQMSDAVLTGDLGGKTAKAGTPGYTGQANTRKRRGKNRPGPGQGTLDLFPDADDTPLPF